MDGHNVHARVSQAVVSAGQRRFAFTMLSQAVAAGESSVPRPFTRPDPASFAEDE